MLFVSPAGPGPQLTFVALTEEEKSGGTKRDLRHPQIESPVGAPASRHWGAAALPPSTHTPSLFSSLTFPLSSVMSSLLPGHLSFYVVRILMTADDY